MGLIQIDKGKCKRDGICAAVCPAEVIRFDGEKFPVEGAGAERGCMACGHCVAACPTEALFGSGPRGNPLPAFGKKILKTDVKALEQFLKMRRSVREFKPTPVPRENIGAGNRHCKVGAYEPTGKSRFAGWLSRTPEEECDGETFRACCGSARSEPDRGICIFKRLVDAWDQGRDIILFNAPHLIVAHTPPFNLFLARELRHCPHLPRTGR